MSVNRVWSTVGVLVVAVVVSVVGCGGDRTVGFRAGWEPGAPDRGLPGGYGMVSVNGSVLAATEGPGTAGTRTVRGFDLHDGKMLWSFPVNDYREGEVTGALASVELSPAADRDRFYVWGRLGWNPGVVPSDAPAPVNGEAFTALDARTGRFVWQRTFPELVPGVEEPVVSVAAEGSVGDTLIVRARSEEKVRVVGLNRETGEFRWVWDVPGDLDGIRVVPVPGAGTVNVVGAVDGTLVVLNVSDGTVRHELTLPGSRPVDPRTWYADEENLVGFTGSSLFTVAPDGTVTSYELSQNITEIRYSAPGEIVVHTPPSFRYVNLNETSPGWAYQYGSGTQAALVAGFGNGGIVVVGEVVYALTLVGGTSQVPFEPLRIGEVGAGTARVSGNFLVLMENSRPAEKQEPEYKIRVVGSDPQN